MTKKRLHTMSAWKLFQLSLVVFGVLTVLTALLTPLLVEKFYPLPPDLGSSWYGWQLATTTTAARISYWAGFVLHFGIVAAIAYRGKGMRPENPGGITRFNLQLFAVNVIFVALHLVQTHLWYDGLAKDVPIWTSQGSVIVMLVLILYMMIPRRGLLWGRVFPTSKRMQKLVGNIHGPFITFALIYTFWFHPMDGNWGLLSGFIYMFLLFIQLILFNTRVHFNGTWIVLLEFFVAVHGTLITVYKEMEIWPMFLFGFLVMFFLTQLHTWKVPTVGKWLALLAFIFSIAAVYGFVRGFNHIYEITFIPVALYGGALALVLIGFVWDRIADRSSPEA